MKNKKLLEIEIISNYDGFSFEEILKFFENEFIFYEIFEKYKNLKEYLDLRNITFKK